MRLHVRSNGAPEARELTARRRFGRTLSVAVGSVVGALVVIAPVGAASAQPSASAAQAAAARSASVEAAAVPAAAVPAAPVQAAATAPPGGVTLQTAEEPLTDLDIALVTQVRLAGLWEIPAGLMAMKKGQSPRVRQIGQMIASQHVRL